MAAKQSAEASASVSGSFRQSSDASAKKRAELFADALVPINLDVQLVVNTVLTAAPGLRSLRDDIAAYLKDFDVEQFDSIRTYAEALAFAHTAYLAASAPPDTLPQLAARAMELRDQLLADSTALARRNLVDGKRLQELKGGNGYLNVGSDLGVLVSMLRDRWSDVKGKSAIQQAEVDEAERLFERVTNAYAERAQLSSGAQAAADERARAYTLLVKAYDQARRAASYLRWTQNDADKIVPSLYAGRNGSRGKAAPEPVTDQPVPVPAGDGVTDGTPLAPLPGPGMPGGSPFVNG